MGQIPVPGQPVALPMLSGSMNPAIPVGSKLQILVQKETECRVGDVVVFLDGEKKLTAHRILLVLRLGYWQYALEKGDSNPLGRWRHAKDIHGRVLGFEGHKQTHVRNSRLDFAEMAQWGREAGYASDEVDAIANANTARQLFEQFGPESAFVRVVLEKGLAILSEWGDGLEVEIVLVDYQGKPI